MIGLAQFVSEEEWFLVVEIEEDAVVVELDYLSTDLVGVTLVHSWWQLDTRSN